MHISMYICSELKIIYIKSTGFSNADWGLNGIEIIQKRIVGY